MKRNFVYIILLLLILSFTLKLLDKKNNTYTENYKEVYITYGDTLWDIAKNNISKGEDIRDYIYEIRKLNNLQSLDIYPGEIILVPIKDSSN